MLPRAQPPSPTQPLAPVRLTEQDVTLLIKFLGENLMRAMEAEGTPAAQQSNFIKQNIGRMFEKTQLILADGLKTPTDLKIL